MNFSVILLMKGFRKMNEANVKKSGKKILNNSNRGDSVRSGKLVISTVSRHNGCEIWNTNVGYGMEKADKQNSPRSL